MISALSQKLGTILKKMRLKGGFSQREIDESVEQIRLAMLEADVSVEAVNSFATVLRSKLATVDLKHAVAPGDYIVKVVFDTLVHLLGGETAEEGLADENLVVDMAKDFAGLMRTSAGEARTGATKEEPLAAKSMIMLVGLQGSGKTTTAAKLGRFLKRTANKRVLLSSLDVYRPAAREQLSILAATEELGVIPVSSESDPLVILRETMKASQDYDVVILDTAGRMSTDEHLMRELQAIEKIAKPDEIIFVADAMLGQSAAAVAREFQAHVNLTSIIISRADSDARGGAPFSIRAATGLPIQYVGLGEKLEDLRVFDPQGLASSILGMGDLKALIARVNENMQPEDAKEMVDKIEQGSFDMNDLLKQFRSIKKMGSVRSLLSMLPGMSDIGDKLDLATGDGKIERASAIICSMTKKERHDPAIIDKKRISRISKGAGAKEDEVRQLLHTHRSMKKMLRMTHGGSRMISNPMQAMGMAGIGGGRLKTGDFASKLRNMMRKPAPKK